ncbi:MAG: DUF2513 domain-containing protein [Bacteroidetes bacterium]|nr:DUF2513 domain-containing protein [Bacteroidota bacterium]
MREINAIRDILFALESLEQFPGPKEKVQNATVPCGSWIDSWVRHCMSLLAAAGFVQEDALAVAELSAGTVPADSRNYMLATHVLTGNGRNFLNAIRDRELWNTISSQWQTEFPSLVNAVLPLSVLRDLAERAIRDRLGLVDHRLEQALLQLGQQEQVINVLQRDLNDCRAFIRSVHRHTSNQEARRKAEDLLQRTSPSVPMSA